MIRIERVSTLRQRKEFADYPNILYKEVPQYLPSLYSESFDAMDPEKNASFGFWQADFIDDPEVSAALFGTVEKWAREKECAEIVGSLGFTDLDLEGMLVDGFQERGVFCTYYNYPYYSEAFGNARI